MAAKIAEGEDHVKKAEKYLKTSFMKWSPDYDSAGDEYSRAATSFKVAREMTRTLDCLDKACECYKMIKSLYSAAKMLEQAVLICRDTNQLDRIVDYAERGAMLYRQNGNPEAAAQLLEKAAKILEAKHPDKALTLYIHAAETVGTEGRDKEAAELLTKVAKLQVKQKMWDKAKETIRQTIALQSEIGSTMVTGRLVGGLVLVHLAREDPVAANKAFHELEGWCDSDLRQSVRALLQAYEEMDPEAAKKALATPGIRNLDIEFARMAAKDIPLPEGDDLEAAAAAYGAERALATKAAEPTPVSVPDEKPAPIKEASPPPPPPPPAPVSSEPAEEDDEDEGLC